jgi:hypothetical protein
MYMHYSAVNVVFIVFHGTATPSYVRPNTERQTSLIENWTQITYQVGGV